MNVTITCPKCRHTIDVEEALSVKLEAHFKAEYDRKSADQTENICIRTKKIAPKIALNIQQTVSCQLRRDS